MSTEPQPEPIISLRDVTKIFRGRDVASLIDLNLAIQPGESLALLGPNGSGKTTTIKLLTGLLLPSIGEVRCFGLDPSQNRRVLSRKTAVVFGGQSDLWADVSLQDNLLIRQALYGLDTSTFQNSIEELGETLKTHQLMKRPPRTFSTGEKMRALLLAQLIHGPKLLILDEPTLGLDIEIKEEIRAYLRLLNRQKNLTILLTSHDIGDIEAISDRVVILNKGQMVVDCSMEEMKSRPMKRKKVLENYVPLESVILDIYAETKNA